MGTGRAGMLAFIWSSASKVLAVLPRSSNARELESSRDGHMIELAGY